MEKALEESTVGNAFSFTQPIELRVQELVAGVRSDVGISLYGDDLAVVVGLDGRPAPLGGFSDDERELLAQQWRGS